MKRSQNTYIINKLSFYIDNEDFEEGSTEPLEIYVFANIDGNQEVIDKILTVTPPGSIQFN